MAPKSAKKRQPVNKQALLFWLSIFIRYVVQLENLNKTEQGPALEWFQGRKKEPEKSKPRSITEVLTGVTSPASKEDENKKESELTIERAAAELEKIKSETEFLRAETARSRAEQAKAVAEKEKALAETNNAKRRIKNPVEVGTLITSVLTVALGYYVGIIAPAAKPFDYFDRPAAVELQPNWLTKLLHFLGPFLIKFSGTLRTAELSLEHGADPTEVRDSLVAQLESIKALDEIQASNIHYSIRDSIRDKHGKELENKRIDRLIGVFTGL